MNNRKKPPQKGGEQPAALRFSAVNGALAGAGVLSVGLGYYLLAQGSITAAPILLVMGYAIFLPLAIIL